MGRLYLPTGDPRATHEPAISTSCGPMGDMWVAHRRLNGQLYVPVGDARASIVNRETHERDPWVAHGLPTGRSWISHGFMVRAHEAPTHG